MKAKRWNESVRLVITWLNVTSIGVFGLAFTAPWLKDANQLESLPLHVDTEKLKGFAITVYESGFRWDAMGLALAMHLGAHILVRLLEPED